MKCCDWSSDVCSSDLVAMDDIKSFRIANFEKKEQGT
jgi:hypothetical protein